MTGILTGIFGPRSCLENDGTTCGSMYNYCVTDMNHCEEWIGRKAKRGSQGGR